MADSKLEIDAKDLLGIMRVNTQLGNRVAELLLEIEELREEYDGLLRDCMMVVEYRGTEEQYQTARTHIAQKIHDYRGRLLQEMVRDAEEMGLYDTTEEE